MAIMRRGGGVAEELAAETFISAGAARHHLRGLEAEGHLSHDVDRPGAGRPAHVYRLTEQGKSLFPNSSNSLVEVLLQSIEFGDPLVRASLLQSTTAAVMQILPSAREDASLVEKVELMGRGFDTVGAMTETEEAPNGRVRFMLSNCPGVGAAAEHPFACDMELMIIQRVVAPADVRILERRCGGEGVCRYEITPPASSEA